MKDNSLLPVNGKPIQPLGIGFPYFSELPAELYRSGLAAFVEITPETLCRQRATESTIQIEIVPGRLATAQDACAGLPVVVHGVELSRARRGCHVLR